MVARFFFRLHLSAPLFSFPSFAFQLLSRTSHSSYPLLRSSLLYLLADEAPMKLTPPADEASSANKMKLGQLYNQSSSIALSSELDIIFVPDACMCDNIGEAMIGRKY
ncbi:unnamed protein product [Lactuca saligna]|uniref:Uncharacterized protein n=1 Tax=Lactuca saligna TaxID=75948 RepID=A0AA35VR30_LACSI|nr:unnamed protein product [Lactuca saligna]